MAERTVFIEHRKEGGYAIRKPDSERASAVTPTQRQAIERAQEMGIKHQHIERVRHTNRGKPDQWRKG